MVGSPSAALTGSTGGLPIAISRRLFRISTVEKAEGATDWWCRLSGRSVEGSSVSENMSWTIPSASLHAYVGHPCHADMSKLDLHRSPTYSFE